MTCLSHSPWQIIWLNSFIRTPLRAALLGHMGKGYWKALSTACLVRGADGYSSRTSQGIGCLRTEPHSGGGDTGEEATFSCGPRLEFQLST